MPCDGALTFARCDRVFIVFITVVVVVGFRIIVVVVVVFVISVVIFARLWQINLNEQMGSIFFGHRLQI
jgi:hypothetical protein